MHDAANQLTFELLTWISTRQRTYAETMEVWRTTCPRHTVWDDALLDGLVRVEGGGTLRESEVTLTTRGRTLLGTNRRRETQTSRGL